MNQEPDCVTLQASYRIQASEQQVSTEQQWFSFKASNENAQSWVQWESHMPSLGAYFLEWDKKGQAQQLSCLPVCRRNIRKLGFKKKKKKKIKLTGPEEEERALIQNI